MSNKEELFTELIAWVATEYDKSEQEYKKATSLHYKGVYSTEMRAYRKMSEKVKELLQNKNLIHTQTSFEVHPD